MHCQLLVILQQNTEAEKAVKISIAMRLAAYLPIQRWQDEEQIKPEGRLVSYLPWPVGAISIHDHLRETHAKGDMERRQETKRDPIALLGLEYRSKDFGIVGVQCFLPTHGI